jgi:pimeloyl-ACP methyl ester carboxylesterase
MKKVLKILKWVGMILLGLIGVLGIIYLCGPRPQMEAINNNPIAAANISLEALAAQIRTEEAAVEGIKPDNEARIIWANDTLPQKTEYSIVYLHGFSASQGESMPMHEALAKRYGCNLYLPRLSQHGLSDVDAFSAFTPKSFIESAKEAVAVGKTIGEKVILLSCSTGGTAAFYLAAKDPGIHAIIALSPNIDLADPNSFALVGPWGLKIAKTVFGGDYRTWEKSSPEDEKYWNTKYRVEGLVNLKMLMNATMKKATFAAVKQPVFVGYYFKNEKEQDQTVSVAAILKMYTELGTPADKKRKVAFPDAGAHVIASQWHSKSVKAVQSEIIKFMEKTLKLKAL